MLRRNKKEEHHHELTVEEFLYYKPRRADFEWSTNLKGLVEIKVPKFRGNFGKSFCKIIRKGSTFTANMDKVGSLIWKNCDVGNTVRQILELVKKEFPDEKDIDQRLFLFIRQMGSLGYIGY